MRFILEWSAEGAAQCPVRCERIFVSPLQGSVLNSTRYLGLLGDNTCPFVDLGYYCDGTTSLCGGASPLPTNMLLARLGKIQGLTYETSRCQIMQEKDV